MNAFIDVSQKAEERDSSFTTIHRVDISIYMQQAQHENIGAAKLHVYPEDKIYVALSALLFKTLRCVGC